LVVYTSCFLNPQEEKMMCGHSIKLVLALAVAALVAACGSTKIDSSKADVTDAAGSNQSAHSHSTGSMRADVDPLNDPQSLLAQRSIYFDFDSYAVKAEFEPALAAHAKYLSAHSTSKIAVQGNADERGGREYNLALGQKRAVAVTKTLAAQGVAATQMEAVSFGKEKPKAIGHDEAAWAENRRADIVY
jgi:peptidoglycan-associated lipoprotein